MVRLVLTWLRRVIKLGFRTQTKSMITAGTVEDISKASFQRENLNFKKLQQSNFNQYFLTVMQSW